MKLSYGFIETKGFVAAIEAADVMLKSAKVEIVKWQKPGGALVVVVVQGELGACQAAVDAGSAAAARVGDLISTHIIPRPFEDTENLVTKLVGGAKRKSRAKQQNKNSSDLTRKTLTKTAIKTDREMTIDFISSKRSGVSLNEIAAKLNKSSAEIRVLLKELMDSGEIEKIKQLYFPIHKRGRK